jgi:hypothetical protein
LNFCLDLEKTNYLDFKKRRKRKKKKMLMDRPVWEEPACGARFRAVEGGGEEHPTKTSNSGFLALMG